MMKVLIVDDSSTMRKIIKKTLLKAGEHEIFEAEDGVDAIKKVKEHNAEFDLVLMDINMPKIDGITALKQLRGMDRTSHIPIIMCASEAEKDKVIECIRSGASDYIVKPFTKDIFQEKISRIVKA